MTQPISNSFHLGAASSLNEKCSVFYTQIYYFYTIGRILDLFSTKFKLPHALDLRLKQIGLLSVGTLFSISKTAHLEIGVDGKKIAIAVSSSLPTIDVGELESAFSKCQKQLLTASELRIVIDSAKIEFFSELQISTDSTILETGSFRVIQMQSHQVQAKLAKQYTELGDVDFSKTSQKLAGEATLHENGKFLNEKIDIELLRRTGKTENSFEKARILKEQTEQMKQIIVDLQKEKESLLQRVQNLSSPLNFQAKGDAAILKRKWDQAARQLEEFKKQNKVVMEKYLQIEENYRKFPIQVQEVKNRLTEASKSSNQQRLEIEAYKKLIASQKQTIENLEKEVKKLISNAQNNQAA